MNDQIRLLVEQAKKSVPKGLTPEQWLDVYHTKFAELIVRECIEVASPNYMSTPEDSVYYVEQAIIRIADHFGVRE